MSQQLITSNEISPSTSISAGQITSVNANAITGLITSAQIANVAATKITGTVYVANTSITGSITPSQLSTGAPSWDAFSNLSVGANVLVSGTTTVPTMNTQTISIGTSNVLSIIGGTGGLGNTAIIDTKGNLVLGMNPSPWSQGGCIELNGSEMGTIVINLSSGGIMQNAYYNNAWYYKSNGASSYHSQSSGNHTWLNAPSGTANSSLTWTTAMTLNNSGYLGIGTSNPNNLLTVQATSPVIALQPSNYVSGNQFQSLFAAASNAPGFLQLGNNGQNYIVGGNTSQGGYLNFYTNNTNSAPSALNGIFAAQITQYGNLLVGPLATGQTTGTAANGLPSGYTYGGCLSVGMANITSLYGAYNPNVVISGNYSSSAGYPHFVSNWASGGAYGIGPDTGSNDSYVRIGLWASSTSGFSWNGTYGNLKVQTLSQVSDHRTKENVTTYTDAVLPKVNQLRPVRFNHKGAHNHELNLPPVVETLVGFIAHEVQPLFPEIAHGTKDAVDANGIPIMQHFHYDKLSAILVKAIQELDAKFEAYVASHP